MLPFVIILLEAQHVPLSHVGGLDAYLVEVFFFRPTRGLHDISKLRMREPDIMQSLKIAEYTSMLTCKISHTLLIKDESSSKLSSSARSGIDRK